MGKLLGAVFGSILTLLIVSGGPAAWWYDRHFQGYSLGFTVPRVVLFGPWNIHLFSIPPGLAVRDAAAIASGQRDLATEHNSVGVLLNAFTVENNAVRSLKTQGDAMQNRSLAAVRQAVQSNAWRDRLIDKLRTDHAPIDQSCSAKAASVEAILREGAQ